MENQNTIQDLKEDEPLTCGIYTRFSPRVKSENYTLENQIAMCRERAKKDGVQVDENHIYQDHHISGGTTNRPGFEQMLENIWTGNFPQILYAKDDKRMFRNEQEAGWLISRIWDNGVEIRYCLLDLGDPRQSTTQWFMQRQMHLIAELERKHKADETFQHQRQNAIAGFSNGGMPPYGYRPRKIKKDGKTRLTWEIDPDTAPAITYAFQQHLQGMGAKSIAGNLDRMGYRSKRGNKFSKGAIREWFRNPYPFAGYIVWNRHDKNRHINPPSEWIKIEDAYPAIITPSDAEQVFQRSQANKRTAVNKGLSRQSKYLLTGLLKCPECGHHFVINSDLRRNQFYYVCGTRNRMKHGCSNKIWIQKQAFEDQLFDQIEGTILEKGSLEEYVKRCFEDEAGKRQEHQEQIQSLNQQIVATQHRLENLVTALADNVLPADIIKQRYLEEEIKKKQLEERLNEISLLDGSAPIDLGEFRELLQEELENEDSRKAALQGLIEEIVAHPDYTMEVKYRIGGNDPVEPTSYPHESRYAHGGPNPGICSLHLYFNLAIRFS